MPRLFASVTGLDNLLSVSVANAHNSSSATAVVKARTCTADIGDSITIDLGYSDSYGQVFTGYVKQVEKLVPENIYQVTANDVMVRAMDYFIASGNPDDKYKRRNITAEALVGDMFAYANLTSYDYQTSYFTFGINTDVEVNLVSAYDYAKSIADIVAFSIWADSSGTVHFRNRKPYVMTGTPDEYGVTPDASLGTIYTADMTEFSYTVSDRDLRNRIVVYGANGVHAEAYATSPYLPNLPGKPFYKTVVVGAYQVIDDTSMAQMTANYNLAKLNRLGYRVSCIIPGDYTKDIRTVWTLDESITGTSGDWYVYGINHDWSRAGYTTALDMRR